MQHVGRIMKGQERLPGGRGWKVSYVLKIGFLEVEWKGGIIAFRGFVMRKGWRWNNQERGEKMSVDEVLGAPSDETGLGLRWRLVDPRRNPSPGPM